MDNKLNGEHKKIESLNTKIKDLKDTIEDLKKKLAEKTKMLKEAQEAALPIKAQKKPKGPKKEFVPEEKKGNALFSIIKDATKDSEE